MNAKIQKIGNEIEKTKVKIGEFQSKLRELEKQKTELENADIVDAVRNSDITLADLAAILKKDRAAKNSPATSGHNGPKSAMPINDENKEENDQ